LRDGCCGGGARTAEVPRTNKEGGCSIAISRGRTGSMRHIYI